MPSRDELYRKFGEASEAAQLLEIELGTLLATHKCIDAGLFTQPNPNNATSILKQINKQTLGQLIQSLGSINFSIEEIENSLRDALASRNRLVHSFYLHHNIRINSDDGRDVMLRDLKSIHEDLLKAYDAVLVLSGDDPEKLESEFGNVPLPTGHLRLRT